MALAKLMVLFICPVCTGLSLGADFIRYYSSDPPRMHGDEPEVNN